MPATRRSSGLGSHANGQSNLDHILEHFNQFKRKHITQNRDIIKTNALAQLRIKELEDKVLALEAERATCKLDVIRLQTRLDRAESAARAVRHGWQLVGAGIAALSAVEGFNLLTSDDHDGSRNGNYIQSPAHLQPSIRITLDPNALPAGVARNVARAPELGLNDLPEEISADISVGAAHGSQTHLDDEATREDDNDDDADDDDDDDEDDEDDDVSHHGDGNTVSFSVDDETIKMNGSTDFSNFTAQQQLTPTITLTDAGQASTGSVTMDRRLSRMTSIDSLSSFADDEEVELSTDEDDTAAEATVTPTSGSTELEHGLSVKSAPAEHASTQLRAKAAGRKRKSPSSPSGITSAASSVTSTPDREAQARSGRRRGDDAGEDEQGEGDGTLSASQSEDDTYFSSSRESRHSRRSSMRDRKSVNYALPKLNTKMRKPDPVDLVPAARGEARRHHANDDASGGGAVGSSSGISHEEECGSANGEAATSSAGNEQQHNDGHDAEETARIRTLKGKHEVASTGNLRDLRQKHQQQQEYAARREGGHSVQDDTLSSSSREHSETADEAHNESPRRRSSRKSLHKRRSSSSLPASEQGESEANGAEREVSAVSPAERVKPVADAKPLANGGHAVPSTPKWRAHTSTASAGRPLPSVTGTPIPRPTVRTAGANAQGIKALSVAGRMQRAPQSTTTSQPQQRAAIAINGGKAHVASSNGVTPSTSILGSSARANSSHPQQRSVSAGHAQSTPTANGNGSAHSPTLSGDPTKRNSLHAALTSNEAFATLSASLAGVRTNGNSSSSD